jgi:predicted esterase
VVETVGTYVVMLPPDYATSGKEYPICVILHGNGSTELRHGKLSETFGREGVIYVAPRAPYPNLGVMHGGDDGWTAWPAIDLDENSMLLNKIPLDYVTWVFNCIHDVQSNYRARKGKVFIYGHSEGGHFADLCALIRPNEVESYMAHAGYMPGENLMTKDALRQMKESGVRPYLVHGRQDNVVVPEQSEKLSAAFKEAGIKHTLKIVDGDHGFSEAIRKEVQAWMEEEVRREGGK